MSKQQEITEIASLVGIPDPGPGVGSSVYKDLFNGVCNRFGIDIEGSMPRQAEAIVTAAGLTYSPGSDSRDSPSGGGSTVTLEGLRQIKRAVVILLGRSGAS